ncbi:MAG: dihydrofolate reductase family protein [Planctomycetales bacterium]|nr:dihydrofolate reductase family protein [Planctomycetales bacterium]
MKDQPSRVTLHMAASVDGFIARHDGSVDWLDTPDSFPEGEVLSQECLDEFLASIDCYIMGSHTYEKALCFESQNLGWPYGEKPTYVLTSRSLPKSRASVQFYCGDLGRFVNDHLRPAFRSIWVVGGANVCHSCLKLGLADEIRISIVPTMIGCGIRFFKEIGNDLPLHLVEMKAHASGIVELRYETRK